ncbi:DNA circularization protein [Chromobacterium aquaticum]|uniref:DNA circularization protein n=1 Tax=Chromobacterium aquaticum TaxID=467180 RepID=A0ABV8ZRL7_9NEIS|nr:DNA circularization N-terminal domain-containing protein [Chromobacterium aquaticum]MCD5360712.1 DNA circularization N-terminal domain-containing protein [Chromobacterium aquaticum]
MFNLSLFAGSAAGALVDASFRGVRFECLRSVDSAQRDHAMHEYPYLDGADVEDLGRKARKVSLSVFFWGRDYQQRLRDFVAALDQSGPGELIHPVFGSMPKAQLLDYQISHEADAPDSCTVEVSWVEATPGNPFFASQQPMQQVEAIDALAAKARSLGGEAFAKAQGLLQNANTALIRLGTLRVKLNDTVRQLASMAQRGIAQVVDLLAYPQAFISEVTSLVDDIASWRFGVKLEVWPGLSWETEVKWPQATLADWNAMRDRLNGVSKKIGRASDSLNQAGQALEVWTADEIRIDALLKLTASTSLAKAAASLFHGEATQPTLTPVALEQVAGDVRAALQQTIEQWRKALPGEDARQVIESLRDLGLQVQRSAASLIAAKPPIVTRKVESAANLRQLAHLWYGDSSRATELLRLNPQLAHPNHLQAGELIHGYAR